MPRNKKSVPAGSVASYIHSNLHLPLDGKRYIARKMQGTIRSMERTTPGKINVKDYIMMLEKFVELTDEIRKENKAKGIKPSGRSRKVQSPPDAGVEQKESVNVGADVSTEDTDPFEGL